MLTLLIFSYKSRVIPIQTQKGFWLVINIETECYMGLLTSLLEGNQLSWELLPFCPSTFLLP